ncbi:TIGR02996 domain-containing protein [Gemmata obscuriglobus]|uniref:TIGR02996 domain-containing protein n=1 Tax=Gemmata obscuriglobus TaxID=114 RepID=A0A2Z3GZ12_9BACT|nr:TIGR02996 domain-containing protein [Gemmata obscuriglobus]AWM37911.1 TIGR02996 domain-containing protein [Gemmata obscuriglobus]
MSDEAALRRAIDAEPDGDTPRLVYAGWLDDTGPGHSGRRDGDRRARQPPQLTIADTQRTRIHQRRISGIRGTSAKTCGRSLKTHLRLVGMIPRFVRSDVANAIFPLPVPARSGSHGVGQNCNYPASRRSWAIPPWRPFV